MTARKPLVLNNGKLQQLQSGDTLDAPIIETESVILSNGESATAITVGQPVYISGAGQCKLAKADASGTKDVFALCGDSSVSSGSVGNFFSAGQVVSTDWTAVVGSTTLTAGAFYYLSGASGGMLTTTPPTSGYIVEVGQAISTTDLQIRIRRPIQL